MPEQIQKRRFSASPAAQATLRLIEKPKSPSIEGIISSRKRNLKEQQKRDLLMRLIEYLKSIES